MHQLSIDAGMCANAYVILRDMRRCPLRIKKDKAITEAVADLLARKDGMK
jgi:cystathionine beta-lyase/cystathionine gamma-synthase